MNTKKFSIFSIVAILGVMSLALTGCTAEDLSAITNPAASLNQAPGAEQAAGQAFGRTAAEDASESSDVSEDVVQRPGANPNGAGLAPQGSASSGGALRTDVQGSGNGGGRGNGQGRGSQGVAGSGTAMGPLSEAEIEALLRAIEEEIGAQALYQSIMDTFGAVYPFDVIAASESTHAEALIRLAEKYGITIPEFVPDQALPVFESIEQACQAGVAAEIADAALYDELIPLTTHTDLLRVFENLQRASLENHLPSFEDCQ